MMYQNGLAFAVKVGGKILREVGDKVFVPFGSEYSLVIKNQKQERALVHISIDGQPIDNGGGFIIDGKKTAELERFVKDFNKGNRFKFIERTKKIEDGPRGIKIDDGLITIDFQFEKKATKVEYDHVYRKTIIHDEVEHHPYWWPRSYGPYYHGGCFGGGGGLKYGSGGGGGGHDGSSDVVNVYQCSSTLFAGQAISASPDSFTLTSNGIAPPVNDAGITVAGSMSHQQFSVGYISNLEDSKYTMTMHLLGVSEKGAPVQQAFTVRSKKVCTTCGTENHHSAKFCKECGTALDIV